MVLQEVRDGFGIAPLLPMISLAVAPPGSNVSKGTQSIACGERTYRKKVVHPPPPLTELAVSPLPFRFPGREVSIREIAARAR